MRLARGCQQGTNPVSRRGPGAREKTPQPSNLALPPAYSYDAYIHTSVADGLLQQMLQEAAVEGPILGQQDVLQEVVALLELVPEKQVALRLLSQGWFGEKIGREGEGKGRGVHRWRHRKCSKGWRGRGAQVPNSGWKAWPASSSSFHYNYGSRNDRQYFKPGHERNGEPMPRHLTQPHKVNTSPRKRSRCGFSQDFIER